MASTLALALGIAVVVIGTLATVAMAGGSPASVPADDVEDRVRAPVESRTYSFRYEPLSEERPARELKGVLEQLLPGLGIEDFSALSVEGKSLRLTEAAVPIGAVGAFTLRATKSTFAGERAVWEAPSYGGLEGHLLVVFDTAMVDTLIALFLGPPPGTDHGMAVTLVKIVFRPQEFFVRVAAMTMSGVPDAHGGPAVGSTLMKLLNPVLGLATPKRGILHLLDGLGYLAYGPDGHLTDSPAFRAWWARLFGKRGRRRGEHDRRSPGSNPSP